MTSASDELEFNKFYEILQTEFHAKHQEAQKRCYTICIPQSSSLEGLNIDQNCVDMHVLRPSPFFKDQYLTTDDKLSGTISQENNIFTTLEGFRERMNIRILSEEMGYNSNFEHFKIYLIERPFVSSRTMTQVAEKQRKVTSSSSVRSDRINLSDLTYSSCVQYLKSFPECSKVLNDLYYTTTQLKENYVIMSDFLHDTSAKLKGIWEQMSKAFKDNVSPPFHKDRRVKENVDKSVESYIVGAVHDRLFPGIIEHESEKDEMFRQKLSSIRSLPPEALGTQFTCSTTQAVRELEKVKDGKTPLEKLDCLKNTMDRITEAVERSSKHTTQDVHLTSDDYIPLLLHVLSQSELQYISSVVYYIDNFHWATSYTDDVSYVYVTFKAAVSYLSSLNTQRLVDKYTAKQQKSLPPDCVQPVSKEIETESDLYSSTVTVGNISADRQINRITKLLESSTLDFQSANKETLPVRSKAAGPRRAHGNPSTKSQGKSAPLGDFLSSLREDSFPSYGKQT